MRMGTMLSSQTVSTHASARDATRCSSLRPSSIRRFNSRVREGRDALSPALYAGGRCFNSRVREGRDELDKSMLSCDAFQLTRPRGTRHEHVVRSNKVVGVSTHASARDATNLTAIVHPPVPCFNSRVREGRDYIIQVCRHYRVFQLTRPRGTRPSVDTYRARLFNVSTHASARDATCITL